MPNQLNNVGLLARVASFSKNVQVLNNLANVCVDARDAVENYSYDVWNNIITQKVVDEAADSGNIKVIRIALELKKAIDYSYSILTMYEKGKKDFVLEMLDKGVDINSRYNFISLLSKAARKNDVAFGAVLIQRGIEIHEDCGENASQDCSDDCCDDDANDDADDDDDFGESALHVAARKGHNKFLALLIKNGADVDYLPDWDTHTLSILCTAVMNNRIKTVEFLIKAGANFNEGQEYGTPLMLAILDNNIEIVKLLVDAGADMSEISVGRFGAGNGNEVDVLNGAASIPDSSILKYLLEKKSYNDFMKIEYKSRYCVENDFKIRPPIITARKYGHLESVDVLIAAGADPN